MGTIVWVFFNFGWMGYPNVQHPQQMVGGFLLSMIAGFLMTAVPKFTGSRDASGLEVAGVFFPLLAALFYPSPYSSVFVLGCLVVFMVRRFVSKTFELPPHFIFLPVGVVGGLFGAALQIQHRPEGNLFFYHMMTSALIMGVGGKLITSLLGWGAPMLHQIERIDAVVKKTRITLTFAVVGQFILFISGFLVEAFWDVQMGRVLRACSITWIGLASWKIYKKPNVKTKLVFWLWFCVVYSVLVSWIYALAIDWGVHAAHLLFAGYFGLVALLVSSRVALAHGNYGMELEEHSKIYSIISILILLAGLTRWSAVLVASQFHHYGYAAVLWIVALVCWAVFFVPKIIWVHRD